MLPRLQVVLPSADKITSIEGAVNLAFGIQQLLNSHLSHLYCSDTHHYRGDKS